MTGPAAALGTGPARWWRRRPARLMILGTTAALLTGIAWLGTHPPLGPRPNPESQVRLLPRPVAVGPGVYLLGESSPAAVYLAETSEGLVLIDSGLEADAAPILEQLARLGLDVQRLKAILLTHAHADHSQGAAHLRRLTGARVYAGRGDSRPLREGKPRAAFFSTYYMPQLSAHPTPVDVELAGGETLAFGDTRFAVLATPGHTTGSTCYLLEKPGLRALFTGDVVQCLSLPSEEALGTYSAYLPPLYRGDARDYLGTLRRLRQLPLPDLVLPGHPRMDPVPQSPRLSEERWQALLASGIARMEVLLARYEADGANFLDGVPKQLLPGLHYLGNLGPSAVYCLTSAKGLFLFDAPGGPPLVDFLARRCRELGLGRRQPTAVLLTSADEEATAGLAALVHRTGCQVVAPKAGLQQVRRLCPEGSKILTEEDLEKSGWFEVRAIPLGGRGVAPLAYQVHWAGKTVLLSGRIPVKPSVEAAEDLTNDVTGPGGSSERYLKALARLAKINPDLWLPALPVNGQNANLYDRDWETVLSENRELILR